MDVRRIIFIFACLWLSIGLALPAEPAAREADASPGGQSPVRASAAADDRPSDARAGGSPEAKDPVEAYERAQRVLRELAIQRPFALRNPAILTAPAGGYGIHAGEDDPTFFASERLHVYVEPIGYAVRRIGERYWFGFSVDLALLDDQGQEVARQANIAHRAFESRHHNLETFVDLEVAVEFVPAGSYVLEIVLHDLVDPTATASARVPLVIVEPDTPTDAPSTAAAGSAGAIEEQGE